MLQQMDIAQGGPIAPCHQHCDKRSATCHTECEEYLAYEKERKAFRDKRYSEKKAIIESPYARRKTDEQALGINRRKAKRYR